MWRADLDSEGSVAPVMRAMVLDAPGQRLRVAEIPRPVAGPGQLLLRVRACAVCRTDLHILDGELEPRRLPLVPGHQIVATVDGGPRAGQRVGVPWLAWTCGTCAYCLSGRENLCRDARFTGWDVDGGYADWTVADERYCFPLPERCADEQAAPLLCAGLIGHRALRLAGPQRTAGEAQRLGLYGFGASAHIVCQVAVHQGRRVFAFTRGEDRAAQEFARTLGAEWAGDSLGPPPVRLDAAIIFAPVGALVPAALAAVAPGGTVVCAGIHMSDIPSFPYSILWEERVLRSVANLTRADGKELLALAPAIPVHSEVSVLPLEQANEALARLRAGEVQGALVLVP